jgi:hypothetical protein
VPKEIYKRAWSISAGFFRGGLKQEFSTLSGDLRLDVYIMNAALVSEMSLFLSDSKLIVKIQDKTC